MADPATASDDATPGEIAAGAATDAGNFLSHRGRQKIRQRKCATVDDGGADLKGRRRYWLCAASASLPPVVTMPPFGSLILVVSGGPFSDVVPGAAVPLQICGSAALGVTGELNKLKGTLSTIKAVLVDAEGPQETNAELSVWLEALKDVCYAIDDILDEFDVIALQQQVNQRSIKRKVRHFFSRSNPLVFRFRMGHKIKEIREKLDQIAADRNNFHLPHVERSPLPHQQRETHSSIIAFNVIGRDLDKDLLVDKLVKVADGEGVAVIPIVGIGGLGKTTLAKLVYNDERVVEYFNLRKWVCVSDEFDVNGIIGNIVDKNNLTLEQLQQHLQQTLSDRRYLLILDDVWNEDLRKWRELRDLLLCGAPGSKIVVTTRSQSVVSTLEPAYVHNLRGLSDEESLLLLMESALGKGQMEQFQNLKTIGEQIVRKCKGVPLAITTLGSLLHMNTQANDWCSVRDNAIWNLQQSATDILPALKLSYNHLPPHLKRCFAVCAIFPKGYKFESSLLINIWMALGLLGSRYQLEEGEDIGKRYITELCSRSFFQDAYNSRLDCIFRMHDLMHDLALSVIGSESLALTKDSPMVPNQKVRHVYFSNGDMLKYNFPSFVIERMNLRPISVDTHFLRFKCLRILDLRNSKFETLPSVGGLKHLKYLDIRSNYNLKSFPRSLCKLQSLQTLQLVGCLGLTLPRDFGNLISLRCLSLTTRDRFLPLNVFQRLACLRTLQIKDCCNLECLFQTKGNRTQGIPCGLRNLTISSCDNLGSSPGLPYLTRLEYLTLSYCRKLDLNMDEESIREHGGGLTSLQLLDIFSLPNLVTFPQWLVPSAANTLKHLYLQFCENLMSLPEGLYALKNIVIVLCPQLEERLLRETGEDWHKIAHVPEIYLIGNRSNYVRSPQVIERCQRETGEDWHKIAHVPDMAPVDGWVLSHCGWNSCMESMSMGVPIEAWPMHSDQPRNVLPITKVQRTGIAAGDWDHRDELVP
ncbi:hypothetical protein RJ640_001075 [Escallonia rubra]|uniref:Disease resistance protein RGA3 n=1 Tax=Escallonia rubra TaxID=112253 RepID=A0AA88U2Y9_9ASTE|nr:hypothetical protein RJ640_001075 [Escallonia rubra]